ncbi:MULTISPECIES: hypothetical protein [unclassified Sphingomonas]|uniref:hypothetical protein n=1 Tax=unclassified Sphingomonas TaxID=196159 RepID=UPI002151C3D3|nr:MULTISPECIES: hypothetical protein [unclassified Sphingomonas]MCR5869494.1 hypothetical protein [Sphingomonas sp. J344]UUX98780.1 hypothetical protein LRS08_14825 [Sphingomonas sp. J315]
MSVPGPASAPAPRPDFESEATPIGEQSLVPGVAPIRMFDRLAWRAAQPLGPTRPQRACDFGLFDLAARDQLDLFAPAPPRAAAPSSSTPDKEPGQ